ncbi:MAG: class I SAM-dependent methyltransferase family protein [Nitrososphaerota archaeon]|jgi:tRNA (guanine37-N1)-methyltransferase|nr:class I SAM-dependent methyltransferase family protein [Nitrososphaerota archaeon]
MRQGLKARVTNMNSAKIYNSYDIVGDIAIIKVPSDDVENAKNAVEEIMKLYPRRVKAVFMQVSAVQGNFRVRQLKFLAGENRTVTIHKEHGCFFKVDVERCYISPRLLFEHKRIPALVAQGEVIINMFSGVGCFSILIAKTTNTKVYSIDINPTAYEFMQENVQLNNVSGSVVPLLGDSKEVVNTQLRNVADRVLMPLPELALKYLPYALMALKQSGGCIHYFDFQHATKGESPIEKTCQKVVKCLDPLGVHYRIGFSRIIRSTGPHWYQTVLDIYVSSLPSKFL